jgi:hypothetical protein
VVGATHSGTVKMRPIKRCCPLGALCVMAVLSAWSHPSPPTQEAAAKQRGEATCARPRKPLSYESFYGRQRQVAGESSRWHIRLIGWEPEWPAQRFTFRVEDKATDAVLRLTLPAWDSPTRSLRLNQIDEIDILGGNRALILGRVSADSSVADVVTLPSGRIADRFSCFKPAISPDHRFLAFVKSFPGHPGPVTVNDEYLVYDLGAKSTNNRPQIRPGTAYDAGWAVYPPGATNAVGENLVPGLGGPAHYMSSDAFFWVSDHSFAFADTWKGTVSLVVTDLSHGIRRTRVSVTSLMHLGVLNTTKCRGLSPGAFFVNGIAPVGRQPGLLCLLFRTWDSACLLRRSAELHLAPFRDRITAP